MLVLTNTFTVKFICQAVEKWSLGKAASCPKEQDRKDCTTQKHGKDCTSQKHGKDCTAQKHTVSDDGKDCTSQKHGKNCTTQNHTVSQDIIVASTESIPYGREPYR